jgi:hypothetical protein
MQFERKLSKYGKLVEEEVKEVLRSEVEKKEHPFLKEVYENILEFSLRRDCKV